MHSLILKTLVAYWLAASVVIAFSDLQPHKLIHTPELSDALDTTLAITGQSMIEAWKAGKCSDVRVWQTRAGDAIELASPSGDGLCGDLAPQPFQALITDSASSGRRIARDFARSQVIAVPVVAADGGRFVLLVKSQYTSALQVFGFLPGSKTIQISIVVTAFLAVLIVLPLRRLRAAARHIAAGNFAARVKSGFFSQLFVRIGLRDDIDGLTEDFNAMAARLQSLVAAQKLLLRDVSHELRSPLARLALALELTRDQLKNGTSPQTMEHLDRIERESLRLNTLIGHILSFSYIESMGDRRHFAQLSLASVVDELLPDVQYEAENRSCRIVTSASSELLVTGDSDMLRHAVENIVRNAIRYSPPGGTVEIDIAAQSTAATPTAVVRVSDTGPGVPEDKLNLILNPFYRAEGPRRVSSSGFGIGLAIADRAAHLHSGDLIARNREGGGLVVELHIPLEPALA